MNLTEKHRDELIEYAVAQRNLDHVRFVKKGLAEKTVEGEVSLCFHSMDGNDAVRNYRETGKAFYLFLQKIIIDRLPEFSSLAEAEAEARLHKATLALEAMAYNTIAAIAAAKHVNPAESPADCNSNKT